MQILPKKKIAKPPLYEIEGFSTEEYLFYRRSKDGKWCCLSPYLGNQSPPPEEVVADHYNYCKEFYIKGATLTIQF